jgi:CBS domain containing-hemolysin-like protein
MTVLYKLLFISILLFQLFACSENSTSTNKDDPPEQIKKSAKRGLAYNLTESADLDALKSGVSCGITGISTQVLQTIITAITKWNLSPCSGAARPAIWI